MIREKFLIFSVLRIVVIIFALIMIVKPEIAWWFIEGWKYNNSKKKPQANKLVLLGIRLMGLFVLLALVASFKFMFQN